MHSILSNNIWYSSCYFFRSAEIPKKALLQKISNLRRDRQQQMLLQANRTAHSLELSNSTSTSANASETDLAMQNKRQLILNTIEDLKRNLEDQSIELCGLNDDEWAISSMQFRMQSHVYILFNSYHNWNLLLEFLCSPLFSVCFRFSLFPSSGCSFIFHFSFISYLCGKFYLNVITAVRDTKQNKKAEWEKSMQRRKKRKI